MKTLIRDSVRRLGINVHPFPSARHLIVDYPVSEAPRYGHSRPLHPQILEMIETQRPLFEQTLRDIAGHEVLLAGIHPSPATEDPLEPSWNNGWLPPLDAAVLMHFLVANKPKRYLEIGSGNSTAFARYTIAKAGLGTSITSIDPQPRRGIDAACDTVIRSPLEAVDLALFDQLEAGDILFFDGSHRTFTDSDVTVFFLDVYPRLKPGVLVQIHDIFWPEDYPPAWGPRYYSEQYMLGMLLLYARPEIVMANAFISKDEALGPIAAALTPGGPMWGYRGVSFWLRTN